MDAMCLGWQSREEKEQGLCWYHRLPTGPGRLTSSFLRSLRYCYLGFLLYPMDHILNDTQPFSVRASQSSVVGPLFCLYWFHLNVWTPITPLNSRIIYPAAYWHQHWGIFNGHKQFKMSKVYPLIFPSKEVPPPALSIMENINSILLVTRTKWLPLSFLSHIWSNNKSYQFYFQNSTTSHHLHCHHPAPIITYPPNY